MPLKRLLVFVFLVLGSLFGTQSWAEQLNVYLKTTPRPESLRPFGDPANLSLLVTGIDGRPVNQGTVLVRIDAPSAGLFFSTDYPLVEGTPLIELRLRLVRGRANWKYLFPIRGAYRLAVDAAADDGRKASRTFDIDVRENRTKWLVLGAFSAGLFALGLVAGRIFTGTRANGIALVAASLFAATPENTSVRQLQPADLAVLKIEQATVGKPAEVQWSLARGRSGDGPATLSLTITHLEKQKVVFAVDKIPVAGEWSIKFHFPDGAEYRVAALAQIPGLTPVRTEEAVSVIGVEPPAGPMARAWAYFIALIAGGLAVGRWSKRRKILI